MFCSSSTALQGAMFANRCTGRPESAILTPKFVNFVRCAKKQLFVLKKVFMKAAAAKEAGSLQKQNVEGQLVLTE